MSHPVEQRIASVRGRVRRLVALYGVSWVVAAVLGTAVVLGLCDYLVRFQDRGLRVICTLLVLGVLGWTCYRYLYLVLAVRLRDVDLALRLQRRFPEIGDGLVSSVEFLKQTEDDPVAGSAALRRAVIAQTTAETDAVDFAKVIDRRAPLRAAAITTSICLVAAILVVLDPSSSRRAMARLANPFGSTAWPQRTRLELREPVVSRVARGQAFEIEVIAAEGTKLPSEVRIHFQSQSPDGTVTEQSEPMRRVDDAMVARRENVVRPFAYRVTGGDDTSMDWITVAVVEPPEIKAMAIRLIPPKYTGWEEEQHESQRHVRALVDTRMQITAETTKPLRSAILCLDDGRRIDCLIDGNGYRFTAGGASEADVVIERSGSYWFELIDREGIAGDESRWEIRAVPDAPPTVTIERPTTHLLVTPSAVVPLQVTAKDDLAVCEITLVYGRAEQSQPDEQAGQTSVLRLYPGPEDAEPRPTGRLSAGAEPVRQRYSWDLAGLALTPGTRVVFHAAATDSKQQSGNSEPRHLTVVTPEQLRDHLAGRQSRVMTELARVLKMQKASRRQVRSLVIRLGEIGHLDRADVDHLQAAELNQRQASHSLTSRDDGVPMHVLALLADLDNNRIDSPDVRRRMEAILDEIDRLEQEHLAVLGRELTAAIKAARVRLQEPFGPPASEVPVGDSLARAAQQQDAVIASLERMLGRLVQWDNYRRFHRQIGQLLQDQQEVVRRTAEVGRGTMTKAFDDLRPQERADLLTLSARQLELGRQLDGLLDEMQQAAVQLQDSDPLAAETLADALDEARRLALGSKMHQAGDDLAGNRIGQAAAGQKRIVEGLQEVLDVLANRRRHELVRLVKKLAEAEADLAEIENRQAGLRKKLDASSQETDQARRQRQLEQLAREQRQLSETTNRAARRLQRLLAERAGRTTRQAGQQMGRAAKSAGQSDHEQASREAEAAHRLLRDARGQLAQRLRQAQLDLAIEQLARLEDALKHLRGRQEAVLGQTKEYERLQKEQRGLTRTQKIGLRDLARRQRSLQTETGQLADQLAQSAAFHLGLSGAARSMGRAAGWLQRDQTAEDPTQQAEQNALRRLELLIKALQSEPPEDQPGGAENGSGGAGGAGQGGAPGAVQTMAELKLLKLLQQELNLRTEQLHGAAAAESPTDRQRDEYAALREQQGRLADLLLQMLQAKPQNPEDDPAELPDVRLQQE